MENRESNYVRILKEICAEERITLSSYSSDWAFKFSRDGKDVFVLGYQFGLNPSSVQQVCNDKNITSEVLKDACVDSVYHSVFMTPRMLSYIGSKGNWQALLDMLSLGALVCKDNYGTGGNLVFKVTNQRELEIAAKQIFDSSEAMAVCRYEDIISEHRVIVLDGKIRLVFSKLRPSVIGDGSSTVAELIADRVRSKALAGYTLPEGRELEYVPRAGEKYLLNWKHNLGQGARAVRIMPSELNEEEIKLAAAAVRALGIRFASIDLIKTADGWKVLEVNAGVMMEHFAGLCEENYMLAKEIYRDAILKMLAEKKDFDVKA